MINDPKKEMKKEVDYIKKDLKDDMKKLLSSYGKKIEALKNDKRFEKCEIKQAEKYLGDFKNKINELNNIINDIEIKLDEGDNIINEEKIEAIRNKIKDKVKEFFSTKILFESYVATLAFSTYLYGDKDTKGINKIQNRKPIEKLNENIEDINKMQESTIQRLLRDEINTDNPYLFSFSIKKYLVARNIIDKYVNNKDYQNNIWYKFIRDSFNTALMKAIEIEYTHMEFTINEIDDKNLIIAVLNDLDVEGVLKKISEYHPEIFNKYLIDPTDLNETLENVYHTFLENFDQESIKTGTLLKKIFDKRAINVIKNKEYNKNKYSEKENLIKPYYMKMIIGAFMFLEVVEPMNGDPQTILPKLLGMNLLELINTVENNIKRGAKNINKMSNKFTSSIYI
ncbi:MAG: hypothetical protein ACP5LH_03135 [Candidatus Micrarchaeia archaeon]